MNRWVSEKISKSDYNDELREYMAYVRLYDVL
jgi:hypothetical protein